MRILDIISILTEASVFAPHYNNTTAVKISSSPKGQTLLSYIQSSIPDFDADDILYKVSAAGPYEGGDSFKKPNGALFARVGTSSKGKLFAIKFSRKEKKPIILLGGIEFIQTGLVKHYETKAGEESKAKFSASVKGLVAEALLGVAMYAKLVARGGDLTAQINETDIWTIVDRVKPKGDDEVGDSVTDRNSKISDHISISIKMRTDVQAVFTNPQFRPAFADQVASWIKYANSDLGQRYADALYKNNRPDNISILLAGKAGEKMDVAINVLNAQGQATRKHEQVKLSVKLSDGLIGQQGRGDNPQEVYDNLVKLFGPLGVMLEDKKVDIMIAAKKSGLKQQFVPAMSIAYQEAWEQLLSILELPEGDAELASRVAKLADSHATKNDPTMQVIETHGKGDYRLLNYKGLAQLFTEQNINITCELTYGTSTKTGGAKTPSLMFFDKNNPGPDGRLVNIRVRGRGGEGKNYANNIIEPLKLMKELAAFKRFRKPEHIKPINKDQTQLAVVPPVDNDTMVPDAKVASKKPVANIINKKTTSSANKKLILPTDDELDLPQEREDPMQAESIIRLKF
jgi:hypothetical protein